MTEVARLEERRADIDEIVEGLAVYSKKDRKRAGCIVTIGDDGEFCLHQGLIERSTLRNATAEVDDPEARLTLTAMTNSIPNLSPDARRMSFPAPPPVPKWRCARTSASAKASSTI